MSKREFYQALNKIFLETQRPNNFDDLEVFAGAMLRTLPQFNDGDLSPAEYLEWLQLAATAEAVPFDSSWKNLYEPQYYKCPKAYRPEDGPVMIADLFRYIMAERQRMNASLEKGNSLLKNWGEYESEYGAKWYNTEVHSIFNHYTIEMALEDNSETLDEPAELGWEGLLEMFSFGKVYE